MSMKTVTYRGKQMTEIVARIREKHGDEALVLSTTQGKDKTLEVTIGLTDSHPGMIRLQQVVETPTQCIEHHNQHSAELRNALYQQGLRPKFIDRVVHSDETLSEQLAQSLRFDSTIVRKVDRKPAVLAFVGPTGVGKTTTIAKLASQIRMCTELTVGLVSADSFRIGAHHQLHSYAALLKIPCRTTDSQGLDAVVKELSNLDIILVDTAGCSPRDQQRLEELDCVLGSKKIVERILVLSAPTNEVDLASVCNSFSTLAYSRIVLTKLDESGYLGPIINQLHTLELPLAFFCNGQQVPKDIEPASPQRLAWMLSNQIH